MKLVISLFIFFFMALLVGWLFVLMDCVNSEFEKGRKVLWILVILFVPFLGPAIYLLVGIKQKTASMMSWRELTGR